MDANQASLSGSKAFTLTEYLEEGLFEAYSCGEGRFIPGTPSADYEVCFEIYKGNDSLRIEINDAKLFLWLHTIPSLRGALDDGLGDGLLAISIDLLLPYYPEMKKKFAQNKREGLSFDTLELFMRHFLREGSVFASFGFEHLYEKGILTELHFYDIHGQYRSISGDLDILDEAIDTLEAQDARGPSQPLMNELSQSRLRCAIERRDPIAVKKVLFTSSGAVDAKSLGLAIQFYEGAVFRLLLEHGAEVDGANDRLAVPLYRAARAGCMEAVRLLLSYGADKEGGRFRANPTPLAGAASGGHLEIVRYLMEEKGANIMGNEFRSPLFRAIKHDRRAIIDYLLSAGAGVFKLKDFNGFKLADILRGCGPGEHSELLSPIPRELQEFLAKRLAQAAADGDINAVKFLTEAGADVNSRHTELPLCLAARHGHLEVVRWLVRAGANVNAPDPGRRNGSVFQEHCSPLAEAAQHKQAEVAQFLSFVGATLVKGEEMLSTIPHSLPEYQSGRPRAVIPKVSDSCPQSLEDRLSTVVTWSEHLLRYKIQRLRDVQLHLVRQHLLERCDPRPRLSVGQFLGNLKYGKWSEGEADVEDCQVVAALRAQERDKMARRLLIKVASSREKLLNAGADQEASAGLKAFVDQIGNSPAVFRGGTRAIRDISEGYMPSSLSDVVGALQVANAMRSAVPPSKIVCSKKEFLDDLPRWASLLTPDDQCLLDEITHILWGVSVFTTSQKEKNNSFCKETLLFLQELVNNLVRTSGLSDHGYGGSCDSYRLQSLRQKFLSERSPTSGKKLSLAEWRPLPPQEVQQSLQANTLKPPDPEWEPDILARITVFMAGAIFGAVLLYLLLYRHGLPTLSLPIPASDAEQGWNLDQTSARNCVIVAMYIGSSSIFESRNWKSSDHMLPTPGSLSLVLPESFPIRRAEEHVAGVQSSDADDCIMTDSPSMVDAAVGGEPTDCSPSLSSHLATSPSVTAISPLVMTTETPGSTVTGRSEDGTVRCEHCVSKFQLGKNGRRGQNSNIRKHMKSHHPDTLPNYQRVLHECRWGCGAKDPYKSNIEAHETKHCAIRKGNQPRRRSKWRDVYTGPY